MRDITSTWPLDNPIAQEALCLQAPIRHKTHAVQVGTVCLGGNAPVVVQSMTDTDTADIQTTTEQILLLAEAGSELVRLTVNHDEAAKAVPYIREALQARGCEVPLVGCFHYNGHRLLTEYPACAEALSKYRINPGNVGFGHKRDGQFDQMIEAACRHHRPVRIGVNWGSLDQALTTRLMDEYAKQPASSLTPEDVMREALVRSALESAARAEMVGLAPEQIVLSCKVSRVPDLVVVYRALAARSHYALHLGLTEAGMGLSGMVHTVSALAILLQEGIGDTIRASLTPEPGAPRTREVELCREVLQSLRLRMFAPRVTACPGCGRTTSTYFRSLAERITTFLHERMPEWKQCYPGVEQLSVAVMGCIVNGPGESKHADIGISLPGSGEQPVAPVFIDGAKTHTLRGERIAEEFEQIVEAYVAKRFGGDTSEDTAACVERSTTLVN